MADYQTNPASVDILVVDDTIPDLSGFFAIASSLDQSPYQCGSSD
jgi:hypothetical protein